jgi:UDP-glucose/GDP-mannose dehydrogenase family, central domain
VFLFWRRFQDLSGRPISTSATHRSIKSGDKERRFDNILKIVSGDTLATLDIVDAVYKSVVTGGTHRASSIKIAEFAKVLENTQRDVNIALMKEIAFICDRLGLDTQDVLKAAGTKWNFLPFRPGLVGGHCIGVYPFYIAHKAEELGYHPHVIHSGRRVNDGMGVHVANKVARSIMRHGASGYCPRRHLQGERAGQTSPMTATGPLPFWFAAFNTLVILYMAVVLMMPAFRGPFGPTRRTTVGFAFGDLSMLEFHRSRGLPEPIHHPAALGRWCGQTPTGNGIQYVFAPAHVLPEGSRALRSPVPGEQTRRPNEPKLIVSRRALPTV